LNGLKLLYERGYIQGAIISKIPVVSHQALLQQIDARCQVHRISEIAKIGIIRNPVVVKAAKPALAKRLTMPKGHAISGFFCLQIIWQDLSQQIAT
jgi:hypothetical protein